MFLKVSNVSAWHPISPEKYLLNCPIRKPRKPSKLCLQLAWFFKLYREEWNFMWTFSMRSWSSGKYCCIYLSAEAGWWYSNKQPPDLSGFKQRKFHSCSYVYCELSWGERRDPFYHFTQGLLLTTLAIISHPLVAPKERALGGEGVCLPSAS